MCVALLVKALIVAALLCHHLDGLNHLRLRDLIGDRLGMLLGARACLVLSAFVEPAVRLCHTLYVKLERDSIATRHHANMRTCISLKRVLSS